MNGTFYSVYKSIFIDANEILKVVIICEQTFSFYEYTSYETI